jgi:hypothetical protein
MERDPKKPPRYAWALSALILLATFVSLMQSFIDKKEQDVIKDDMARLLTTMDRLASESNDPALLELVKNELNAQTRSDPTMVERVAQRVSDEGRDPTEVLGKHLDAAEVEKVTRKGSIKAKATDKVATTEPPAPAKRAPRPTADDKDEDAGDKADTKESTAAPARPVMTEEQAKAAAAAAAARRPGQPPGFVPPPVAPAPVEAAPAPTPTPTPRAGATKPTAPRAPGTVTRTPKKPKGR